MMGAWGDVILGAEARKEHHGIVRANYITIMLRDAPDGNGLACTLVAYGNTDDVPDDLVALAMDTDGLRRLAESALDVVRQMEAS